MSIRDDIQKIKDFFVKEGEGGVKELAYLDNPNSIFDDLVRWVRAFFYLLLIPSTYIGVSYHITLFKENGLSDFGATVGSLILFIAIEVLCCFYAPNVFRAIFNGKAFAGLAPLLGIIISLSVVAAGYIFKFNISAKAFSMQRATEKKVDLAQSMAQGVKTSDYSVQMEAAQRTIKAGQATTWKGKITEEGRELIKRGNKTVQELNALRSKEMAINAQRDSSLTFAVGASIEQSRKSASEYGGIIEIMLIACTILIPLFEIASYRALKAEGGANTEGVAENRGIGFHQTGGAYRPLIARKDDNVQSRAEPPQTQHRRIGFDYPNKDKPVEPVEKKTVELSYYEKVIKSYEILLEAETDNEKTEYYNKTISSYKLLLNSI